MEKSMKKIKAKNNPILKFMAIVMLMIFCGVFLVGCVGSFGGGGSSGGGSSGGSSSGSGSGSNNTDYTEENPYKGAADKTIDDFNDLFMGAIGVYEVDNTAEVFYDNYLKKNVNFESLINRQFTSLATILYDSLHYVYGSTGAFEGGNINNYDTTAISFAGIKNDLIGNAKIYMGEVRSDIADADMDPKYTNAINGNYIINKEEVVSNRPVLDGEGNQMTDDGGNLMWEIDIKFTYSSNVSGLGWVNKSFTIDSLANDLKELYKEIFDQKDDLKTIGFTSDYKDAVLEYINKDLIGNTNIDASNAAKGSVLNGTSLYKVNETNYTSFPLYKGYEKIVPALVDNAFKLYKDGSSIKISDKYCYENSDVWDKTLFPSLGRYEYVFYDDVNDICDAEANDYPDEKFDTENFKPNENYEPDNFDPDYDFEEDGAPKASATYKVGSLRKLKEIIMLPTLTSKGKTSVGGDTFNFMGINIAFARPSGDSESRVNIVTTVIDNNGNLVNDNQQVDLDDGTYSFSLPGEKESMTGGERVDFVTEDGYIIVDEVESGDKAEGEGNKISADIFKSATDRQNCKFGNLPMSEADIKKSFTSSTYTVETTGETIAAWKLNVWNNLVKLDMTDIYKIDFDKNIIRFKFNYFNSANSEIDIPLLYLMNFSFLE